VWAQNLDHFKCYKVKDLRMPRFTERTVALEDQFGVNDGNFEVRKPVLICNPANKNGEGINNAAGHLTCYKVRGPRLRPRPSLAVGNQLGTTELEATKPALLCVASLKTLTQ
jgi:hypothetical protein